MSKISTQNSAVEADLAAKLRAAFQPVELHVINESHLHHGHHGSPGTGTSHFRVRIVSAAFAGLGRVARHRAINDVLAAELKSTIHALAIEASAPNEQKQ